MTYEIKTEDLRSYLPRLRIGDRVLRYAMVKVAN